MTQQKRHGRRPAAQRARAAAAAASTGAARARRKQQAVAPARARLQESKSRLFGVGWQTARRRAAARVHTCCTPFRAGFTTTRRGRAPALCRRRRRSRPSRHARRRTAARQPPCPPVAAARAARHEHATVHEARVREPRLNFRNHEVVLLIVRRVRAEQQFLRGVVLARVLLAVLRGDGRQSLSGGAAARVQGGTAHKHGRHVHSRKRARAAASAHATRVHALWLTRAAARAPAATGL